MTDHQELVYQTGDGTLTISLLDTVNLEFKTRLTCAEYCKRLCYEAFRPIADQCVQTFLQNVIEEKTLTITRSSGGYVKDSFISIEIPIKMGRMSRMISERLELSEGEGPDLTRDQSMNVMAHKIAELEAKTGDVCIADLVREMRGRMDAIEQGTTSKTTGRVRDLGERFAITTKVERLVKNVLAMEDDMVRKVSVIETRMKQMFGDITYMQDTQEISKRESERRIDYSLKMCCMTDLRIDAMEKTLSSSSDLLKQILIPVSEALTIDAEDFFAYLRKYYPKINEIASVIPETTFFKTQRKIMEMANLPPDEVEEFSEEVKFWKTESPFEDVLGTCIPHHVIQTYRSLRNGITNGFMRVSSDGKDYYLSTGSRFVFFFGYPDEYMTDAESEFGCFCIGTPGDKNTQVFDMDYSLIEYNKDGLTTLDKIKELEPGDEICETDNKVRCMRITKFTRWW